MVTFQQNGLLTLNHPQKECTLIFKAKWVEEFHDGGAYYWYGEVPESPCDSTQICDCVEGVMNVMYDSSGYNINLTIDEDLYRIEPIGGDLHIIMKFEDPISDVSFCGNDHVDSLGTIFENQTPVFESVEASLRNDTQCPVRVLFLFTLQAHAKLGGLGNLKAWANESIHYTNQAYRNSRVFNLSLEYAGIQHLDWVEPLNSSLAVDDLKNLMSPGGLIAGFRQQYNADIVILFLSEYHGYETGGKALDVVPDSDLALAYVNVYEDHYRIPFYVAHETSHLFGCRHHDNKGKPDPTFNRAYRYWTPGFIWDKKRVTVGHEGTGTKFHNVIQHYSNPEVNKHGAPTGAETRNNALQLRNQACNVASFTSEPALSLNLRIHGDRLGCPCDYVLLGADYNVIQLGNYQFEWRISQDGFNWGQVLSSLSSYAVQLPCQIGEGLFVQLTLILPDGTIRKTSTYVEAVPDPFPGILCIDPRENNTEEAVYPNYRGELNLYPNPTKDFLNVEFTNDHNKAMLEKIDITILNALGQIQYSNTISTTQPFTISIANWTAGVYWIHVSNFTPKTFIIEK